MPTDPTTTLETMERFVFAGRWSMGQLLAAGAIMLVVIVASAAWERRAGRGALGWLLTLLRAGAVAIVLWMLAEPTLETVTRHKAVRRLAIAVDASASMQTVDPPEPSAWGARWNEALTPSGGAPERLDRAVASLGLARLHLRGLPRSGDSPSGTRSDRIGEAARKALAQAAEDVHAATRELSDNSAHRERVRELELLGESLRQEVLPRVIALGGPESPQRSGENATRASASLAASAASAEAALDGVLAQARRTAEQVATDAIDAAGAASAGPPLARAEKIERLLAEAKQTWLEQVRSEAEVMTFGFTGRVEPAAGVDGTDQASAMAAAENAASTASLVTDLTAPLEFAARERAGDTLAGLVLLTDGQHNAKADALGAAAALRGVPLLIVPIGNSRPVRDVLLHRVRAPRTVIQNDQVVLEAMLQAEDCQGEEIEVELLEDGKPAERQPIRVDSTSFGSHLVFRRPAARLGEHRYELRARAVKGEQFPENNIARAEVEVIENKIRVLLADRLPRWEHRFLRNLFKRDEHLEFKEVQFEPEPTGELPNDLEEWSRYRVLILGDLGPEHLTPERQRQLEQYVTERGGTLVVIAGNEAMPASFAGQPLEPLLPIERLGPAQLSPAGFTLQLTAEGRAETCLQLAADVAANDRLWTETSGRLPVYPPTPWCRPRAGAHTLINLVPRAGGGPGADEVNAPAFLAWHYVGNGRVVYLAAPVTYQLRFREGDRLHHRLWGQLLRWAIARELGSGSKTVRLSTDKARYQRGDAIQLTVRLAMPNGRPLAGGVPLVEARRQGRLLVTQPLAEEPGNPGTYRGVMTPGEAGALTLQVVGREVERLLQQEGFARAVQAVVAIDPERTLELSQTRCNLALLNQIAETCDGIVVPPAALGQVVRQLDLAPEVSESSSQRPQWDRWWLLAAFTGCVGLEWLLRKWRGYA